MPTLTVLAGPNGAGKTTFGERLQSIKLINCKIINVDYLPEHYYAKLSGDYYRADKEMGQLRYKFLEEQSDIAIGKKIDFCYECNLRNDQVVHIEKFYNAGYKLNLVFMYLESVDLSIERVKRRVKQKGMSIPVNKITGTYDEGLLNLDQHYKDWNLIYILNNNYPIRRNKNIEVELIIKDGNLLEKRITNLHKISEKIPNIYKLIK